MKAYGCGMVVRTGFGDLLFVVFDLLGEVFQNLQTGLDGRLKLGVICEKFCCPFVKADGAAGWDAQAGRLE